MNQTRVFGLGARCRSFRHAFRGVAVVIRTQHNAWVHSAATIITVTSGFLARLSGVEWCFIVLAICSVWTAECLNTAIEYVTDLVSPEFNTLARNVKDAAAGAVLVAAAGAVLIGFLVFYPHIRIVLN